MKAGTENRRKTIIAGGLGSLALIYALYTFGGMFFGGSSPAPTPPPPVRIATPASTSSVSVTSTHSATGPSPVIAGVAAAKLASTSSGLDPTLDQVAMLRTESLEYAGTGRNIFSATYTPPPPPIPKVMPSARPNKVEAPPVPAGPPVPPPPPPINLKYFGTIKQANGKMQGFFLSGEDVYLASEGEIVARKYKIKSLGANQAAVEDLQYTNTQSLPLQH